MKKLFTILTLVVFLAAGTGMALAHDFGLDGPAPSSGDGDSEGSGFDTQNGPNDSNDEGSTTGPAPNSGDGISDGSGF